MADTEDPIQQPPREPPQTPERVPPAASSSPAVQPEEPDQAEGSSALPFPVVGIGASAGGVEAYIQLFSSLAPDTGMAFVAIPHLLADHKSHMSEILGRHTSMTVADIVDGARPEPDKVYVLPPNVRARLEHGLFHLEPRPPDGLPRTIDHFFRSLAADQKTRAVGVVLSGTDSDGALGLTAIKGEGGITFVQSPESARFSEMPRTSISVDHVDCILAPGQIGAELSLLGRQFRKPQLRTFAEGPPQAGEELNFGRILALLRGVSGVDFRLYKPASIRRRIARRMLLHRMQNLAEYAAFLQGNLKELRELQEDALISVTRFFRDPGVWDAFKSTLLPLLFANREPDQQIRVWVAGCSSGEEVYSIVISLLEYLSSRPFEPPIQIFGTDASDQNIYKARSGIYPDSIAGEISPERLRRFFVKVDKGYQVTKRLRDLCIFARQNLCHDPPFSRMDLISCRNVLIYLGDELQRQILPTFHYALRPNGYLLLGTSETIREFTELFQPVDRKNKFFSRIGDTATRVVLGIAPRPMFYESALEAQQPGPSEHWGDLELQRTADRIVLARYAPPGVIVDENLEILQSRGHTSAFIEMPQGAVSLKLPRMLRRNVAVQVTQAVQRSIEHDIPVRVEGLRVDGDEPGSTMTLEVVPIHSAAPRPKCYLVLFGPPQPCPVGDLREQDLASPEGGQGEPGDNRLRQDLVSTKLYLQTLLEERDVKNQELVSANEEIQSANEEMQSVNEELETTKEELQSSNEELQTVNDELHQRNAVLSQTSNDLSNLLNSVHLPVLMLSSELLIRHFTPPIQRLMSLRASDVGRPFADIRLNLDVPDLEPLFSEVLETLAPRELEVQDRDGHWYLLRVRPYRTSENRIEGLVVLLLDIDQLRRSQLVLRGARDFARSVIQSIPLPLAVLDLDLQIESANEAFRDLAGGAHREDLEGRFLPDLASAAWALDEPLRGYLEDIRATRDFTRHFEFEHRLPSDPSRVLNVRVRAIEPDGEVFLLVTIEDVTLYKEVERLLNIDRDRLTREIASAARELGRTRLDLRALTGSLFTSQEEERRRVGRELHDDICQKLAVLEIDTEQIVSRTAVGGEPRRELERVRTALAAISEDVRRLSRGLHPAVLDDLGLATALRVLVEDFRQREQMIVTFTSQDVPEHVDLAVATGLYRIAQEGLRNIARHAGKTHVKVALKGGPSGIRLQIVDFGTGFDVHAPRTGLGLISMEERARMMNAQFRIESEPGAGTRVTVEAPPA